MRAPGAAGDFVAEVAERIGFPVRFRAECGTDSGFQVRGPEVLFPESGIEPADLVEQPGDIGYRLAHRQFATLAYITAGECAEPAGDFVTVDGQGRYVPRGVRLVVQKASFPQSGWS